ncbi:hypothetical protein [Metabacillus fastidiosus]|uniref:hypothetical protein n=1 Tax=Metabacillus fastidiosus TaxID=1458 RepID=UPI003D27A496
MIDDMPNVLIVPDNQEKPDDIIQDYFEMIMQFKDDPESIRYFLEDFFDDVNYWSISKVLIDQAKITLSNLEELKKCETEFIEDDLDFDDGSV